MAVYLCTFLVVLLLQFIPVHSENQYKIRLAFSLIPIFLFFVLKEGATDLIIYEKYFDAIQDTQSDLKTVNDHMEVGFAYLCKIMPTFRSLVALSAFLYCLGIWLIMYRFISPNSSWIVIVFLFLGGGNSIYFVLEAMRNGFAVSLLMISLMFAIERKPKFVVVMCILAMSIHTSAIVAFLLLYFLSRSQSMTREEMLIWIIVSLFFLFLSASSLAAFIEPIVSRYFVRYKGVIDAVDKYSHFAWLANIASFSILLYLLYLLRSGVLIGVENAIVRVSLMYPISYLLGAMNTRVTQYFIFFYIISCGLVYIHKREIKYANLYLLFSISVMGYAFNVWLKSPYFAHQIYHSILDK